MDGADEDTACSAATISKQHGATAAAAGAILPATGFVSRSAANGWTSAPTAKNTAAGPTTAARTTDGLRRSLATECLPTEAPYELTEANVTKLSRRDHRTAMVPVPHRDISAGHQPDRPPITHPRTFQMSRHRYFAASAAGLLKSDAFAGVGPSTGNAIDRRKIWIAWNRRRRVGFRARHANARLGIHYLTGRAFSNRSIRSRHDDGGDGGSCRNCEGEPAE